MIRVWALLMSMGFCMDFHLDWRFPPTVTGQLSSPQRNKQSVSIKPPASNIHPHCNQRPRCYVFAKPKTSEATSISPHTSEHWINIISHSFLDLHYWATERKAASQARVREDWRGAYLTSYAISIRSCKDEGGGDINFPQFWNSLNFGAGTHISQDEQELIMQSRMTLNLTSSCLLLASAGIRSVHHSTQPM